MFLIAFISLKELVPSQLSSLKLVTLSILLEDDLQTPGLPRLSWRLRVAAVHALVCSGEPVRLQTWCRGAVDHQQLLFMASFLVPTPSLNHMHYCSYQVQVSAQFLSWQSRLEKPRRFQKILVGEDWWQCEGVGEWRFPADCAWTVDFVGQRHSTKTDRKVKYRLFYSLRDSSRIKQRKSGSRATLRSITIIWRILSTLEVKRVVKMWAGCCFHAHGHPWLLDSPSVDVTWFSALSECGNAFRRLPFGSNMRLECRTYEHSKFLKQGAHMSEESYRL